MNQIHNDNPTIPPVAEKTCSVDTYSEDFLGDLLEGLAVLYGTDKPILLANPAQSKWKYDEKSGKDKPKRGMRADVLRLLSSADDDKDLDKLVSRLGNKFGWQDGNYATVAELDREKLATNMKKAQLGLSVNCINEVVVLDIDLPDECKEKPRDEQKAYLSDALSKVHAKLQALTVAHLVEPSINGVHVFVRDTAGACDHCDEDKGCFAGVAKVGLFCGKSKQIATCVGKNMQDSWTTLTPSLYCENGIDFSPDMFEYLAPKTDKAKKATSKRRYETGSRNNTVYARAQKLMRNGMKQEQAKAVIVEEMKSANALDGDFGFEELERTIDSAASSNAVKAKQKRDNLDELADQITDYIDRISVPVAYKSATEGLIKVLPVDSKKPVFFDIAQRKALTQVEAYEYFYRRLAGMCGVEKVPLKVRNMLARSAGVSAAIACEDMTERQPCWFQELQAHSVLQDGTILSVNPTSHEVQHFACNRDWQEYLLERYGEARPAAYRVGRTAYLNFDWTLYQETLDKLAAGEVAWQCLQEKAPLLWSIMHYNLSAEGAQCMLELLGNVVVPCLSNAKKYRGILNMLGKAGRGKTEIINAIDLIGEGIAAEINNPRFVDTKIFEAVNVVISNDKQDVNQCANRALITAIGEGGKIGGEVKCGKASTHTSAKRLLIFANNHELQLAGDGNEFLTRFKQIYFAEPPEGLPEAPPTTKANADAFFTVAFAYMVYALQHDGFIKMNEYIKPEDAANWQETAVCEVLARLEDFIDKPIHILYDFILEEYRNDFTLGEQYQHAQNASGERFGYELTQKAKNILGRKLRTRGITTRVSNSTRFLCLEQGADDLKARMNAYHAQKAKSQPQPQPVAENVCAASAKRVAEAIANQEAPPTNMPPNPFDDDDGLDEENIPF